ncbi:MAG: endonuclease/exonuclease/phosphatase family protein [Planctomycetota bacterium]
MLNHFRVQFALVGVAVCLVAMLIKRRVVAVGFFVVASLSFLPVIPTLLPGLELHSGSFLVAHINVGGSDPTQVQAWIESLDDGVPAVMLLEVRPGDALATSAPKGWAFALQRPTDDTRGLIVLCRPGEDLDARIESFTVPGTTRDMAVIEIAHITIMQAHLARPGSARGFEEQRAMSQTLADWSRQFPGHPEPVVVVGDFNAAPWSAAVEPLREAGLRPSCGSGSGTWPSVMPFGLRVPIDHAFSNTDTRIEVGPHLGGDHRPILVEIAR